VLPLLFSTALAQTSPALPPGFDLTALAPPVRAESRWVIAASTSDRFPDTAGGGPDLAAGDRVEVIVEENGRARFKLGDRYGWVSATALSSEAPAPAPAPALTIP
jgi:hypothetical protein